MSPSRDPMAGTAGSRSLLNLYEVKVDGVRRHFVCLLDPVLAGARVIDARAIVGEYSPGPSGGFDPRTFQPNPAFIEAFTRFMNDVAAHAPEVVREALALRSQWLYIIDSRHPNDPDIDPPPGDIIGCFAIDGTGQIVPNSFQYNTNHVWFDPSSGVSGLFSDRRFYAWLHPEARS